MSVIWCTNPPSETSWVQWCHIGAPRKNYSGFNTAVTTGCTSKGNITNVKLGQIWCRSIRPIRGSRFQIPMMPQLSVTRSPKLSTFSGWEGCTPCQITETLANQGHLWAHVCRRLEEIALSSVCYIALWCRMSSSLGWGGQNNPILQSCMCVTGTQVELKTHWSVTAGTALIKCSF